AAYGPRTPRTCHQGLSTHLASTRQKRCIDQLRDTKRSTGTAPESSSRHTLLDHPLHHPQQRPALGGQHGRRGIGNVLLLPTMPRPNSVSPSELPQHRPLHVLLSRVLTTRRRLFDIAR